MLPERGKEMDDRAARVRVSGPLAQHAVRNYLDAARLPAAQDGLRLDALTAGDVTRFVVAQCRDRRTGCRRS
jgi:hypothetical protein